MNRVKMSKYKQKTTYIIFGVLIVYNMQFLRCMIVKLDLRYGTGYVHCKALDRNEDQLLYNYASRYSFSTNELIKTFQ